MYTMSSFIAISLISKFQKRALLVLGLLFGLFTFLDGIAQSYTVSEIFYNIATTKSCLRFLHDILCMYMFFLFL